MELKLNEKYMLTIKEVAVYYGIGMKFLRRCAENGERKFSVVCGNIFNKVTTRRWEKFQFHSQYTRGFTTCPSDGSGR